MLSLVKVTKVLSLVKVTKVLSLVKVTKVLSLVKVTKVLSLVKVIKVLSLVKVTKVLSLVKVTKVLSLVKVTKGETVTLHLQPCSPLPQSQLYMMEFEKRRMELEVCHASLLVKQYERIVEDLRTQLSEEKGKRRREREKGRAKKV